MMSDSPRTTYQRVILCVLAAMAVLFGVLTGVSRSKPGVLFEEVLLAVSHEGEKTVCTGSVHGDDVTILSYPDGNGTAVEFTREGAAPILCRVEWLEDTVQTEWGYPVPRVVISRDGGVLFEGGYDRENKLFFEENGTFAFNQAVSIVVDTSNPWSGFEFGRGSILRFAGEPELSRRGSWKMYALGVFLSVIAALSTAFPYGLFYLQHFLSVENPEPTEFYMFCQRIGMAGLAVLNFFIYCWALYLIE